MKRSFCAILFLVIINQAYSQEQEEATIDELNCQLENPLSRFWSMIFQENNYFNTGDLIDGNQFSNVFKSNLHFQFQLL